MSKRVSLYVLLLVTLGVLLSHLSVRQKDNGYLLVVTESEVDVLGMAHEEWVRMTRQCDKVSKLDAASTQHQKILQSIQTYSPPQSGSANVVSLLTTDTWALAEVEFKELLPAVVLLELSDGQPTIVSQGIWSGMTRPWLAAPHIRAYLSRQAPHVPDTLLDCFDPQSPSFRH